MIQGTVSGLQARTESPGTGVQEQVWSFRVDCYDTAGNIARRYPVEIRGESLSGSICDGDIAEVSTAKRRGELLTPDSILNLTTAAETGSIVPRLHKAAKFVVTAVFLVIVGVVAWNFMKVIREGQAFQKQVQDKMKAAERVRECFSQQSNVNELEFRIRNEKDAAPQGFAAAGQRELSRLQLELEQARAELRACQAR